MHGVRILQDAKSWGYCCHIFEGKGFKHHSLRWDSVTMKISLPAPAEKMGSFQVHTKCSTVRLNIWSLLLEVKHAFWALASSNEITFQSI